MQEQAKLLGEREKAWLEQAIKEFDHGEYFACHETLELLWRWDDSPRRVLWQAILHVAVSLYLLQKGRWKGAEAQARKATQRLRPFAKSAEEGLELGRLWFWLESYECLWRGGGDPKMFLGIVGVPFLKETVELVCQKDSEK
ncbi:MAG: DUF309 domain-containing protein [Myxococcales bacterium]|nr:DUF309 domain-containing protein [Myxococcales bacterium]